MSVETFIDINVFIYQLERVDTRKADIAEHVIEQWDSLASRSKR